MPVFIILENPSIFLAFKHRLGGSSDGAIFLLDLSSTEKKKTGAILEL